MKPSNDNSPVRLKHPDLDSHTILKKLLKPSPMITPPQIIIPTGSKQVLNINDTSELLIKKKGSTSTTK